MKIGIFTYGTRGDVQPYIALALGFRLKTNFLSPYKAASTSEFWQRWHVSLSSWLKEYLYIPLGGNKKGTIGSYICIALICLVMILLTGKIWLLFLFMSIASMLFAIAKFSPKFKQIINTNINLLYTLFLLIFYL